MAQQGTQGASIILGPAVLGKEEFARQQAANALNTGAIGLGKAHAKPFVPNGAVARVAEVLGPEPDISPVAGKAAKPGKASVPANAKPKSGGKNGGKAKQVSFTEEEVDARLKKDPNDWTDIVEAEAERAEGPRPVVAQMLVSIADAAKKKPIPPAILTQLIQVAGITAPESPKE